MQVFSRLSAKPQFWSLAVGPAVVAYAGVLGLLGALRTEHVALLGAWALLAFWPKTHGVIRGLFPFFLFGLVYDSLRFVTPVLHGWIPPHVEGPYRLEAALFGVTSDGRVQTPPELLAQVDSSALLLLCAFAYFFYIYEVCLFGIYLVAKKDAVLRRFGWAFFTLCMLGFITWYAYPAAPPWYALKYGLGLPADLAAPGDPARLAQVDALLGITFFHGMYVRSSNVFGAIPSLHAAYPLLVWLYVRHSPLKRFHWVCFGFWILMSFSAVFLGHHYVIDVLLGSLYALIAYYLAEELLHRRWPAGLAAAGSPELGGGLMARRDSA